MKKTRKALVLVLAAKLSLFTFSVSANPNTGVYVDSSGNVGVGNTAPLSTLDVNGNITVRGDGFHISQSTTDGNDTGRVVVSGGGVPSNSRGGIIAAYGNENAYYPAQVRIGTGEIAGSKFVVHRGGVDFFMIDDVGRVGIGITDPQRTLHVNGDVKADAVITDGGWYDYVFDDDYSLTSLEVLESKIKENRHLPDIPSAEEIAEKGINIGEIQGLLLKKIEELTLYVIDINKKVKSQNDEMAKLKKKNRKLEERVSTLKTEG